MGSCGIDTLCYNFMPVLDWSRTDLSFPFGDGSLALKFDWIQFVAFDLFMLKRTGAADAYTAAQIKEAKLWFDQAGTAEREAVERNLVMGLPGRMVEAYSIDQVSESIRPIQVTCDSRDYFLYISTHPYFLPFYVSKFRAAVDQYKSITREQAQENLFYFLRAVVPVAEQAGVRMAIHPDDPPFTLLGLPRIVSTEADVRALLEAVPSPANGLTMCVGTFSSREDNDVEGMVERLADKIHFVHLRNVSKQPGSKTFVESNHLEGDVDM